jgi:hypothetical protein
MRSVADDARRLAAWAATYPYRSKNRWREAEAAYQWFWESGIDHLESLRRWELVVHLVHNFKSQVLLDPIRDWPLPETPQPVWPISVSMRSGPSDLFRQQVVDAVIHGDYLSVGGIGLPIASALCALVSTEHAIVDRFARGALAGLSSCDEPICHVDVSYASGLADDSTEALPSLNWEEYQRYLETLHKVARASDLGLRDVERAMFRIGQDAHTDRARKWGAYRLAVRQLLECDPDEGPDRVWDEPDP